MALVLLCWVSLEAVAAVCGMDFFNEYLREKQFILYTDHYAACH